MICFYRCHRTMWCVCNRSALPIECVCICVWKALYILTININSNEYWSWPLYHSYCSSAKRVQHSFSPLCFVVVLGGYYEKKSACSMLRMLASRKFSCIIIYILYFGVWKINIIQHDMSRTKMCSNVAKKHSDPMQSQFIFVHLVCLWKFFCNFKIYWSLLEGGFM